MCKYINYASACVFNLTLKLTESGTGVQKKNTITYTHNLCTSKQCLFSCSNKFIRNRDRDREKQYYISPPADMGGKNQCM